MQLANSFPLSLLAKDLMKRCSFANEFIRILSPSSAPPVFFLVGSVASKAIFNPGLSLCILSINSSVRLDFPAPPVPVKPITGHPFPSLRLRHSSSFELNSLSSPFSANVSNFATAPWFEASTGPERSEYRLLSNKSI